MKYSRTAYHEAAHAVLGYYHGFKVMKVSIISDKVRAEGFASLLVKSTSTYEGLSVMEQIIYARKQLHILFAGATSEIFFFGDCNPEGANTDMNRAKDWVEAISKHTGAEVSNIVHVTTQETKIMVEKYGHDIETVASILERNKEIKNLKKNLLGIWTFK